jgi:hypothetical protein
VSTYSVASNCHKQFGAGYTNRRYDARGRFRGSTRATPASRKIRANDAVDGATNPSERIRSNTLIGPQSSPERSNAARTCNARSRTTSPILPGLFVGRRDFGCNAAAGPASAA